ncbi:MAG TPA: AEC family transporter [Eubacteriaceae bacterium]|jgi:predicted permease|nr:AEC family transporter [Eubacteriaceae bacterium]
MDFFLTFQKVSVLFLLIVVGYIVGKTNIISKNGQRELSNLVLRITMPATIILALQLEYTKERFDISLKIMFTIALAYIGMIGLSKLLSRLYRVSPNQRDIIEVASILPNNSFMGYPVVLSILGREALFFAVLGAGLVFEVVSWTYGNLTVSRSSTASEKSILRNILLSPGILSIAIGFTLFILSIRIPEPLYTTMDLLSGATSPLAMIVVGILLSRSDLKSCILNGKLYTIAITKLLVFPLTLFFILNILGFSGMGLIIPVVILSMPTAAYVAIFSANSGNDTDLASQIVFIASLLSLATIPLMLYLVS